MDRREIESPDEADYTAAVPLEIDEETATRADDLLREFAEDAGLETALVVDRSGALVAGISAEAEVTIEVISALVAGASGAMRALVSRLGETGAVESLHLGGNRLVYLKEIVNRFILVAVAEVSRPAGLVRQKALAINPRIEDLLREVRPAEITAPLAPQARSLRAIARERAAQREAGLAATPVAAVLPPEVDEDSIRVEETETVRVEEIVVAEFPEEVPVEESFETLELTSEGEPVEEPEVVDEAPEDPPAESEEDAEVSEEIEEPATPFEAFEEDFGEEVEAEPDPAFFECDEPEVEFEQEAIAEPEPEPIPREILEPIDFGEPEIVIESSAPPLPPAPLKVVLPVDSPFEAEDDEEEDEPVITLSPEPLADVFELEAEDEENVEDEDEEDEDEESELILPEPPSPPQSLFEVDAEEFEEDFEGEIDEENDEVTAEPVPPPLFPEYSVRRPTSLFELADDDDLDEDLDEPLFAEDDEDDGEPAPENVFEVDLDDDEEDLLDDPVDRSHDAPPSPTLADPEAEADESPTDELEEMIAEEEEESEIRSSGPFYF
jgi:predicted regulator of Ras-like GTPase activity (Roadblock/LC7/MglB family)